MDDYDDEYDEYPYTPPPKTLKQIARERIRKVLPFVPYIPLAVGIRTRSTNWLLVAIFTLFAVKPAQRFVTVNNSHFTSSAGAPGLQIA